MVCNIKNVKVKTVLSKSGIPGADYCINPFIGCFHGCRYCYASFMKKYTGHNEKWGSFVDVKINAPDVLLKQLKKAEEGNIIISSVTDPYQPAESKYQITRKCLEVLFGYQHSIDILTKSSLILRDIELIKKFKNLEVGITITTDNENVRRIFEPNASPIMKRIETLKRLHDEGIHTYAFIGPVLPMNPEYLCDSIKAHIDHAFIDRMNYISKTKNIYRKLNMKKWIDENFISDIIARLKNGFGKKNVFIC